MRTLHNLFPNLRITTELGAAAIRRISTRSAFQKILIVSAAAIILPMSLGRADWDWSNLTTGTPTGGWKQNTSWRNNGVTPPPDTWPDAANITVNINNDITGAQTINNINKITVGFLNWGDPSGAQGRVLNGSAVGGDNGLHFSATNGATLTKTGGGVYEMRVGVTLDSDLTVFNNNNGNSQRLWFSDGGSGGGVTAAGSARVLTIGGATSDSTIDFTGVISNGSGSGLGVVVNSGLVHFDNANTYANGTTVSGGELVLRTAGTIGTGNLSVSGSLDMSGRTAASYSLASTQAVSGDGTITIGSGKTLTLNGTISPGVDTAVDTLTFKNGTLELTSTTAFEFTLGTSSDQIALTSGGALALGAEVIEFTDFSFTAGSGFGAGTYTLIGGASSLTGSLGSDLTGEIGGFESTLSLSGNDLVLTVVPEPQTVALVTMGLLGMVVMMRRRRIARNG